MTYSKPFQNQKKQYKIRYKNCFHKKRGEDNEPSLYDIYFDLKRYHSIDEIQRIHNSDEETYYLISEQINRILTRHITDNDHQTLLNWFREPSDIADIQVVRLIQLSEAAREFRGYNFLLTLHTIDRANLEDSIGLIHYFMYLVVNGDAVRLDDDIEYNHDYNYFIPEQEHM
jgi:hypothetical protein